MRFTINKAKEQQNIFKKEEEIKEEYNERINIFLEELEKFVEEKSFDFYELVITYFEVLFRFRKEIPKEFSDLIFEESKNQENFENGKFKLNELIKLTFILSRYNLLLNTKSNAEEGLDVVTNQIVELGLANLKKDELLALITNITFKNVYSNLELFTKLEPHILKYLNELTPTSLVLIFSSYIRNYCGSNFFIQSIGFSIVSNLNFLSLRGKIIF